MRTLLLSIGIGLVLSASADAAPARKTYTISTNNDDGGIHVTKVTATVPAWSEKVNAKGSPEFARDPVGMFATIDVLQGSPETAIKILFGDAQKPTTETANGRTWIVDRQADGHVHAALLFSAAPGFVAICETRHDTKKLDLLAEVKQMCSTFQLAAK